MTLGHVHLKVRNLLQATEFYTDLLGLEVTEFVGGRYAFLTAGRTHHDLALQHVGERAPLPPHDSVGLFHVAFEVPDKRSFAEAYSKLEEANVRVNLTDHRISWAMYFADPSGNSVELYCDTRREVDGVDIWQGVDRPLDKARVLSVLNKEPSASASL